MKPLVTSALLVTAALAQESAEPSAAPEAHPDYVYEKAWRLRVMPNEEYPDAVYHDLLPGIRERPYYYVGYRGLDRGVNVAVAQRHQATPVVFYENNTDSSIGTVTDHARFWPLTLWHDYILLPQEHVPGEHPLFLNREKGLGIGPAPTHPQPQLWGQAPGTYLACRRELNPSQGNYDEVLRLQFAFSVMGEDTALAPHCVQVKLVPECAPLPPLHHNRTGSYWNHEWILDGPCVKPWWD
ncbi:hypothetical protein F4780DRAFT_676996 [Xylariomycetidae sp. FL0641]|nr:hypothetical protein F4780DRAFT_676996 [Xylariomycetidae sp. FL0641]